MKKTNDLSIEWFLREEVKQSIEDNSRAVAQMANELEISDQDWDGLSDCLNYFIPLLSLTAEELAYAMELCSIKCVYESLVAKEMLIYTGEGYEVTEKGYQLKELIKG